MGLKTCKIRHISTELLSLIYVENWFLCSILGMYQLILFKVSIWDDIWEEWFLIIDRSILLNKHTDIVLYVEN